MHVPRVRRADLEAWAGVDGVVRAAVRWRVPAEAVGVLAEPGLPRLDTRFVPEPQPGDDPLLPAGYVIGRDDDGGLGGVFVLREGSGEVCYELRGESVVNSSLRHFVYFLHKLGSAEARYAGLPDDDMMRRFDAVVARLKARDPDALNAAMSFWRPRFVRLWG